MNHTQLRHSRHVSNVALDHVPVLGQIGAGKNMILEFLPILRWRDVRRPREARPNDRIVAAEICGDSLSGANILDGDYAIVILTHEVQPGQLTAVLTPQGLLVKYLHYEADGRVRLESANIDYPPRWYDVDEIKIQGRVVRIERDI